MCRRAPLQRGRPVRMLKSLHKRHRPEEREAMLKLLKIVALSLTLATPAVAQQYTPIPPIRNFTPRHHHNPVADLERPECKDKPGLVKGQKGYAHCRDHHFPQQVFTTANCKCSVGECRETEWKTSLQSPTGTIFKYVDDAGKESWCPVDKFIDMKKIRVRRSSFLFNFASGRLTKCLSITDIIVDPSAQQILILFRYSVRKLQN